MTLARLVPIADVESTPAAPGAAAETALGIEIGGTKLQSALVAADGTVLLCRADRVGPAGGADGIRAVLAAQIDALVADAPPERMPIRAVGIGFGGPVDRVRGIVATSFHVDGWSDFPLSAWVAERLSERLGDVPVVLENDSNAAAFAEATCGAGRGARVVVYSNSGSGIGAGLVIEGRLHRGRPSGEMELGHLRLTRDGRILEDASSGWAIDRLVAAAAAADPSGMLARAAAEAGAATARLMPAALAAGDAAARSILEGAAGHYAHALSHVVHLLNPDVIVLGGGVTAIGEPWRESVARQLETLLMEPLRPAPPVRLALLGADVVPVGAALVALTATATCVRSPTR